MDIYKMIKQEHKEVRDIFKQMEDSTERATKGRKQQLEHLHQALIPHMYAEENLLYPQILNATKERLPILEAFEEHEAAKSLLSTLDSMPVDDERWAAKVKVLEEMITHHIKEEEGEIFKEARKVFSAGEAKGMVERFEHAKQSAHAGQPA